MRWLIALFVIVGIGIGGGVFLVRSYPSHQYHKWVEGEGWNKYYTIPNYRPLFLRSPSLEEIEPYKEDYVQLWRDFPIRNSLVPLPTRHPLFQTVPIVELRSKTSTPQLGMTILSPEGRAIIRVYTLPMGLYQDHSHDQGLFKLPYVRNRIKKVPLDQLWADIFSREIKPNVQKTLDDMIYDLYLLHLRSKLLPKETTKYGLIKGGKQALIELSSGDKDYKMEVVLTQQSGSIYSYILKTEKVNPESRKLRTKFLDSITFTPVDDSMGRILYTEFKELNFSRQVDQEGMLYLFSAWSQDTENVDLLKELIFYLERGRKNSRQLQPLYAFALKKYGKTYTTRAIFNDHDDPEVVLQRKIEIEGLERKAAAESAKTKVDAVELTPDERMNVYLKEAKTAAPEESGEMTVH